MDYSDDIQSNFVSTKRGKGRIAPRSSCLGRMQSLPKIAAVSHRDAIHGEREGDPPPRFDPRLSRGWVSYIPMDSPQNIYRAIHEMYQNLPVLLQKTPLVSGIVSAGLDFATLADSTPKPPLSGPRPDDEVMIRCSDTESNKFIDCDDGKNFPASVYHLREPETQRLMMTFSEFVQCTATWESRRLFLKHTIIKQSKSQHECVPLHGPLYPIARDFHSMINWTWLDTLRHSQNFGHVLQVDLESASVGSLQPARYSLFDEMLAQIRGRRRVLIFPPSSAFDGLYSYPVAHPYDKYSMVDLERLDTGQWPGCTLVHGLTAILQPGDVLFVPAYYLVHEQDLEKENITLRIRLHPGNRPPSLNTASLRLSRVIEERVAALEGPMDVLRWLSLIGCAAEGPHLYLGSVQGYKRAIVYQGIRDDIDRTLGIGAWTTFLPAMCRYRLRPTPWLNANFREPLLLSDKPVIIEDIRTDEERRYPQLFRKKLEKEGWNPSFS